MEKGLSASVKEKGPEDHLLDAIEGKNDDVAALGRYIIYMFVLLRLN